ncbi:hypothetical protein F5148DRAFT_1291235 [Russula earlei]|uniref:Uncharacterized protein n=1 Tax=Russula earlei TaxID=71964 RepID=A0ACC0TUP7_9AGAM|nr:hypothetical protein F5148DRAFT_1291235 [Russula earlei]
MRTSVFVIFCLTVGIAPSFTMHMPQNLYSLDSPVSWHYVVTRRPHRVASSASRSGSRVSSEVPPPAYDQFGSRVSSEVPPPAYDQLVPNRVPSSTSHGVSQSRDPSTRGSADYASFRSPPTRRPPPTLPRPTSPPPPYPGPPSPVPNRDSSSASNEIPSVLNRVTSPASQRHSTSDSSASRRYVHLFKLSLLPEVDFALQKNPSVLE